jgi:CHAD domain-containing protein
VADALGDWHDAEVHAATLKKMRNPPPGLHRIMVTRRQKARQAFMAAWPRLIAPRFTKHILAALQAENPPRK